MEEILMLKIRNLIADKEHINQRMSRDIAQFGQWSCDYEAWYIEIQKEIDEGFKTFILLAKE